MTARIKTKPAAMAAFTQYQVWQDGFLVRSYYDRKDAIAHRNRLNENGK